MSYTPIPSVAYASLPSPSTVPNRIYKTTNVNRGMWYSDGTQWQSINGNVYDVRIFGAKGDGSTDDSTAIQLAVDSVIAAGGGTLNFQFGSYNIGTTTILLGTTTSTQGIRFTGSNYVSTSILYSGTGDAFKWTTTGAVNGSGFGQVQVENLRVVASNGSNAGAGIDLVGGYAYFEINNCYITGFKYPIILDQTEVSHIHDNILESNGATKSACIWLVNGDEHTGGATAGFTNVCTINNNQLAGGFIGVLDEGGNRHTISDNNFDSCACAVRACAVQSINITGNSFESTLQTHPNTVLICDVALSGSGAFKGTCSGGLIFDNGFYQNLAASGNIGQLGFETSSPGTTFHTGFVIGSNYFNFVLGRGAAIFEEGLGCSVILPNFDYPGGGPLTYIDGVHNDAFGNTRYPSVNTSIASNEVVFGRTTTPVRFCSDFILGIGGSGLSKINTGTVSWTPTASLADGAVDSKGITVSGAAVGDLVIATFVNQVSGTMLTGFVDTANHVVVTLLNKTGGVISLSAGALNVITVRMAL